RLGERGTTARRLGRRAKCEFLISAPKREPLARTSKDLQGCSSDSRDSREGTAPTRLSAQPSRMLRASPWLFAKQYSSSTKSWSSPRGRTGIARQVCSRQRERRIQQQRNIAATAS